MNISSINYKQRGNQPAILSQILGLMFCFVFFPELVLEQRCEQSQEIVDRTGIIKKKTSQSWLPSLPPGASWPVFFWNHLLSRDIMDTSLSEMGTGCQGGYKGFL